MVNYLFSSYFLLFMPPERKSATVQGALIKKLCAMVAGLKGLKHNIKLIFAVLVCGVVVLSAAF
jgi:hypothetical protein